MKLIRNVLLSILGGGVLAFGLYNVHSLSGVTEGGALGLTLLLQHWLNISPAWSGLIINFTCYAYGLRTLGRGFLAMSALSGGSFSFFYAVFERFPRLWPELAHMPLPAAPTAREAAAPARMARTWSSRFREAPWCGMLKPMRLSRTCPTAVRLSA